MLKYILLFTIFLFQVKNVFTQTILPINYYLNIEVLKKKTKIFLKTDVDSAIICGLKGVEISQKLNADKSLGKFYSYLCVAYQRKEKYDKALFYGEKNIALRKNSTDTNALGIAYQNTGNVYYRTENFAKAKEYYTKALDIFNSIAKIKGITAMNNSLGVIAKNEGEFEQALSYYYTSLRQAKQMSDSNLICVALNNIGSIYLNTSSLPRSKDYLQKAVQMSKEIGNSSNLMHTYINLGFLYSQSSDYDSSIIVYQKALRIAKDIKRIKILAKILSNISGVYLKKKNYQKANYFSKQAEELFRKENKSSWIINCLICQSECNIEFGKIEKSKKQLAEALQIAQEKKLILKEKKVYEKVYLYYKSNRNYKDALNYHEKYTSLKDSIINREVASTIEKLNVQFETEKKEQQLILKNYKILAQKEELKLANRSKIITLIGLSIVLVLLMLSIILYINKLKAYRAIVKQNIELAKQEKRLLASLKTPPPKAQKYESSNLDEISKKVLFESLENLMLEKEPFLNPKLTIEELAKKLNTNRRYLSQVINEFAQKNFNTYINEFRIKKARQILINNNYDYLSLEGIASQVGFHSKATFNNSFKKYTGVTPSFFKKNKANNN